MNRSNGNGTNFHEEEHFTVYQIKFEILLSTKFKIYLSHMNCRLNDELIISQITEVFCVNFSEILCAIKLCI